MNKVYDIQLTNKFKKQYAHNQIYLGKRTKIEKREKEHGNWLIFTYFKFCNIFVIWLNFSVFMLNKLVNCYKT